MINEIFIKKFLIKGYFNILFKKRDYLENKHQFDELNEN
jgi:hypothetical protein